jgi:hypothetical protein
MKISLTFLFSSAAIGLATVVGAAQPQSPQGRLDKPQESASSIESNIQAYRVQLLELAFDAGSSIPQQPHLNDRSRAQSAIVEACLQLEQPALALQFIEQIDHWRQGAAHADYAFYLAQRGDVNDLERYLALAARRAESAQDWRRDRIKAKIVRVRVLLNQHEQASALNENVADSEAGTIEEVKAMIGDEAEFDRQMAAFDALIAQQDFDLTRGALEAAAQWFNRFYQDVARRELAESKIKSSWSAVPVMLRIELLLRLTEFALNHQDRAKALDLVNQAQQMLGAHQWSADYEIVTAARIAGLRHISGDADRAQADLQTVAGWYESRREQIMGIDRAGALRAIAEAHAKMKDAAASLRCYSRAVDEGADNPNARPRALDLSATCASMARAAVEPDEALWARLRQIRAGLTQPW